MGGLGRFEGRVVAVTGAAAGIGRATALRVAAEGAAVACLDRAAEACESTSEAARAAGADAFAVVCDVADPTSVERAVAQTVERFERLDALCNVAGILQFGHSHTFPLEDWDRILAVNLTGTYLMCRAAIPHLLASRGAIVNVSSTAALAAHAWTAAYSASKGGVLALTHTLAIEYGRQGLRVNAVCPGAVKTAMHEVFRLPEGADPKLLRRIMPFNDFAEPAAAAAAIAFLASDDARHVNGAELRVDGGMLA